MISHPMISALLPELIVVIGAAVVLLAGLSRRLRTGGLAVLALGTIAAAFAAASSSGPTEPVHSLRVDELSRYTRLLTLAVGFVILLVNLHVPIAGERGEYFGLALLSLAGIMLVGVADDLILLFLALELVSIPTYVLIGLSRVDLRAQEASGKYFFLGAFAAAFMLYGFSFLYGAAGTTTLLGSGALEARSMPTLAAALSVEATSLGSFALLGLLFALAGLAFKIAAVPLHFYVPDVYQGAASPITGMLGFVPKMAGIVALIRVLSLTGWRLSPSLFWLLWIMAAVTMTYGNTLALMQQNVKRMLAYSSIAHSGYILVGLLAGPGDGSAGPTRNGLSASLFYIGVYGLMNMGAFAALAYIRRARPVEVDAVPGAAVDNAADAPAEELEDLAGAGLRHPWATVAFAVCVLSLMGVPPLAGFLGKVYVFSSALAASGSSTYPTAMVALVVIGVVNSAIAAGYYLRIVAVCYLRPAPDDRTPATACSALRAGLGLCAVATIALFVFPRVLSMPAGRAGDALAAVPQRSAVAELPARSSP